MSIFSLYPNYDETFPHLDKAPIAEAVIDLQVVSLPSWDVTKLKTSITSKLPEYKKIEENREVKYIFTTTGPKPATEDLGCVGFKISSADGFDIAQFNKRGLTVSRVKQYNDWRSFCSEANKLWSLYREFLNPPHIKRIGVRFINRLIINYASKKLFSAFKEAPEAKQICGWELENFLHRDVLRVPNTDYRVNLIKTIASAPAKHSEVAVILDSDVFYEGTVLCDWEKIEAHLHAMHWIKNKVFFESLSKKKIKEYK